MTSAIVPFSFPCGLVAISSIVPALFVPHAKAAERFFEFFTVNIRNKNTQRPTTKLCAVSPNGARVGDFPT
jgi:hypothetical protein